MKRIWNSVKSKWKGMPQGEQDIVVIVSLIAALVLLGIVFKQ